MLRRWCEALQVSVLGIWLGALVMTGTTAALAFPTLRGLKPTLADFAAVPGDEHWRIAAGSVMQRVFLACDVVQLIAAGVALVTMGLILMSEPRHGIKTGRVWLLARTIAVATAVMLVAYQVLVLAPRMNANLAEYYVRAREGEMEVAARARAAFDAEHPLASRLMTGTAGAVLAALVCGAWVSTRGVGGGRRADDAAR